MSRLSWRWALVLLVVTAGCQTTGGPVDAGDGETPEPSSAAQDDESVVPKTSSDSLDTSSTSVVVENWRLHPLEDDVFAADVEVDGAGLVALMIDRDHRFELVRSDRPAEWQEITGWMDPGLDGLDSVEWFDAAVVDGDYLVTGTGRRDIGSDEKVNVPISVVVDGDSLDMEVTVDQDRVVDGWIADSVWFGDVLVGVGSAGIAGQAWGPGLWTLDTDRVWREVPAPAEIVSTLFDLVSVAASPDIVVAVGRNNESLQSPWVLWSTNGSTWQAAPLPEAEDSFEVRLTGVAYDGTDFTILGVAASLGGPFRAVTWRSDDGIDWTIETVPESAFGDGETDITAVGGGDGVVLAAGRGVSKASPLYCYDNIDTCQQPFTAIWVFSNGEWRRMNAPDGQQRAGQILATPTRVITTGRVSDGGATWEWPNTDRSSWPYADPFDTSPPVTDLPIAGFDAELEPGVEYASPLDVGCLGMDVLGRIGDTTWILAERLVAPQSDWPIKASTGDTVPASAVVFGTIELTAPDEIAYAIPGLGIVATYEPAQADYEMVGCL